MPRLNGSLIIAVKPEVNTDFMQPQFCCFMFLKKIKNSVFFEYLIHLRTWY